MQQDHFTGGNLDVWSMPSAGMSWCECGQDHELTAAIVYKFIVEAGYETRQRLTHGQLSDVIAYVWKYSEVCRFFHLAVEQAAKLVHGKVDKTYPLGHSVDIIGYFSKTWQGCPDAAYQDGES